MVQNYKDLVGVAQKQVEEGIRFKQPRIELIQKNEDLYFGKVKKALKGRFNVPLPIMSGFIDTLMAKIDDPPSIAYEPQELADVKKARKVTAAWEIDSSAARQKWARKDRGAKKMAAISGRAILKYFASSDPEYKSHLELVDYHDFVAEPMGGGELEDHLFCGQINIFRTKAQLTKGVEDGVYDRENVESLINKTSEEDHKQNEDDYNQKNERFARLGMSAEDSSYVGQSVYNLTEWCMDYEGERYYLLFDRKSGACVRAEILSRVFKSNLYPWVSWATNEDPFNFWSKGPADDIRPVAEAMAIVFNQALDNRQKINFGQRAFDADIFPDPSQLEWRPDGLVEARPKLGQAIGQGIYEFKVAEVEGTIDLFAYLDNFTGQKTGITAGAQGASDKDTKVGVYYGDLQQVADRLGLYNKSYMECWTDLGVRYYWGLKEHMTTKMMVKMIGTDGVAWEELIADDLVAQYDFDVKITGGSAEIQANEVKKKQRTEGLMALIKNPAYAQMLSPRWVIQQTLVNSGYDDREVKAALNREYDGDEDIIVEAELAIQDILNNKKPKINRSANTAFIQHIVDYATEHEELDGKVYGALIGYAQSHIEIAAQNMISKTIAAQSVAALNGAASGMPAETPTPATAGGTQAQSQQLSADNSIGMEGGNMMGA